VASGALGEATIGGLHQLVTNFVVEHQDWAAPIVFVLAFGESLALVSPLVPATAVLFAMGGLIGATGIGFWSIWFAAALGAVLGDWVSYWLGRRYKYRMAGLWPLSRHPALLSRGEAFFRRWGAPGVFIGRFFGPLRAVVPLVAGICGMPALPFQIANVASALLWASGILAPGVIGVKWLL
jgi:membrane protein DedA with SNARE-associated domain